MTHMEIEIDSKKQIELAAESLAQIMVQQVISRKNKQINKKIENKYGKPN